MVEFECKSCGNCCKNFYSISILDFELERFLKNADKFGYKPNILIRRENTRVVADKHLIIMYSWEKGDTPCPFINKSNQCSIYNEKPLFCSLYPFPQEFHAAPWLCYYEENLDSPPEKHHLRAFFPDEVDKAYSSLDTVCASAALLYSFIKFYLFGKVMFVKTIRSLIPITKENSVNLSDFFAWYSDNGKRLKKILSGINGTILADKDKFTKYLELPEKIEWYRTALPNFDNILEVELTRYFKEKSSKSVL
jgi:Fe-S-cluster containining protein